MSGNRPDATTVAAQLTADIERLAVALLGEPNRAVSSRTTWRWGRKGSFALEISGPKRGVFCDHEAGIGGDALDLVAYIRRCSTRDAWEWSLAWTGVADDAVDAKKHRDIRAEARAPVRRVTPPDPPQTLELARTIWGESVRPEGTPAEVYLQSRGICLEARLPIRFHPRCPRDHERLPAMLALMTNAISGVPCGVHRTFLRPDGNEKAHGIAKMMAGSAGIVRLVPDDEVWLGIGIAEGIETSLSIMRHAGWRPVWACCSAGGIAKFPVLQGIDSITIFPDADDKGAGLKAARECAERWRGANREVTLRVPPAGCDWNDVARRAA